MPGGVQKRFNATGVIHGFPRVPMQINDSHVLRRYLQDLRDALNEYRWLFGGLAGLSEKQQKALTDALLRLLEQQLEIKRLNQSQNTQNNTLNQLNVIVAQLQQNVATLIIQVNTLNAQVSALQTQNTAQQGQIDQLIINVTDIQNNCC